MAAERSLILFKPDGVGRRLVGEVVGRIERKGLGMAAMELRTLDRAPPSGATASTRASRSSTSW